MADGEDHRAQLGLTEMRLDTDAPMSENPRFYPRLEYVRVDRRVEDGFDRVDSSKLLW